MASEHAHSFTIAIEDFDLSLLPPEARKPETESFQKALNEFLQSQFLGFSGKARIVVDAQAIHISWEPQRDGAELLRRAKTKLETGKATEAALLARMLVDSGPKNAEALTFLGLALNGMGKPVEAEAVLSQAVALKPDCAETQVALGEALELQGKLDQAEQAFRTATERNLGSGLAQRRLGMHLINTGRSQDAMSHLKLALKLDPKDQQAAFSLAEACKAAGELAEADSAYQQTIALNEYSDLAEKARLARREFAYEGFRARGYSGSRPDAVMFCLSALKHFQDMSAAEIKKVTLEITLLGRKGLDVHDPTQKYSLKSLKGSFSGLHLLSTMYVGFKAISPDKDIGFDLSQEYQVALALHQGKKGK